MPYSMTFTARHQIFSFYEEKGEEMSVFERAGMNQYELASVTRWARKAEESDRYLRNLPGGYGYYSTEGILRACINVAKCGESYTEIDFPYGTPEEKHQADLVQKEAGEAGLTTVLVRSDERKKRIRFSW